MDEKRGTYMPTRHSRKGRLIFFTLLASFLGYTILQIAVSTPKLGLDKFRDTAAPPAVDDPNHDFAEDGTAGQVDVDDPTQDVVAADALPESTSNKPVQLEAHIMSKCPDAKDCLQEMILPAMMRVEDKVNWTLSFIGAPTENDGVECKHGPDECMGNIIELCAAELYPDPKISLGFTMCITREYRNIPKQDLIEACALEHAMDISALNECAARGDGAYGMELLRNSVTRSADAGVTKSCTVRLDEEIYCIRDGGQWSDCPHGAGVNDLVINIEKRYQQG